jgi:hypothetical protein
VGLWALVVERHHVSEFFFWMPCAPGAKGSSLRLFPEYIISYQYHKFQKSKEFYSENNKLEWRNFRAVAGWTKQ